MVAVGKSLWDQPQAANLSRKDDTCCREGRHRSWSEQPPTIPHQEGVSYGAMVLPTQAPGAPLCQPLDTEARLGRALLRSPRACPIVRQTHPVLLSLGAAILVHEVRGPTCHLWTQIPNPLQAIMQLHTRDDTHIMNRHSSIYRDCNGMWSLL